MNRGFRFLPTLLAGMMVLGIDSIAAAQESSPLPAVPMFSRHIVPLFSKLGCNAGTCHGTVKGQNGFRLSLFGAEPVTDHERLVREASGRRLNFNDPDASLLLLKAVAKIPHEGGMRLAVDSPEYRLLRSWIARGAPLDDATKSVFPVLTLTPASHTYQPGETAKLRVQAAFPDGTTQDVTAFCSFESRDTAIADVDAQGRVTARALGETVLLARYRGQPVMSQALIPGEPKGAFPAVVEKNFIDRHIHAKLKLLHIHPAEPCDDLTFLRRVSLDVTGALPTPDEIRSFLADKDAKKREKKIDELLDRPGYAALWATKFCDILRPAGFDGKAGLGENASTRRFYEWLRARLRENMPYDQMAERILLATSRDDRPAAAWIEEVKAQLAEDAAKSFDLQKYASRRTLDLYWQRTQATGVKGALHVSHAFLGLRMECAQCHRHPHDVWQQDDLLSFANYFMAVSGTNSGAASPEVAKEIDAMTKAAKELKDQAKKLTDQAKGKAKEELATAQKEAKALSDRAKTLDDAAKRIKASEIRILPKSAAASVTSTLGSQKSEQFRLLGDSKTTSVPAGQDPRATVMAWMRRPDNPYFARAIVNRVWAHYFGRGIVDPPDHLSPLNPPTHPELLAELCADFVKHGYDLKRLHRLILHSRTYQQSAQTNATSKRDTSNYASFYLRRLPAEVLVDALNHATAGKETYPPELHLPPNILAIEVAGSTSGGGAKLASLHYAFHIFGRPLRSPDVQCDCERDATATVVQTLFLANHPTVQAKIASPDGRVAQVLKSVATDEKRIEELFLWTLSRFPTDDERRASSAYMKGSPSPQRGLEDLLWGLLNTREFLLNH